mmetsp:Transcript_12924/g.31489  ORF Transcript_12924/g.31489 Transcript_12924/m.31489 type:complete len:350 (+) Transcript_12924:47-1096(+)
MATSRADGANSISHDGRRSIALKSVISGSIAGISSTCLFHPFDVLRTKIQTASFPGSGTVDGRSANGTKSGSSNRTRPLSVLANTFRNGGIRALYTGVTPVLGAQAVYKSTVFTVNNLTMSKIKDRKINTNNIGGTITGSRVGYTPTLIDIWMCGAAGGFVNATLFVSPVEYVRNQQIAQHTRASAAEGSKMVGYEAMRRKLNTPFDIIRTTFKERGVLGLWRGTGVTVMRDSLGCGGFFVMNELGKRVFGPYLGGRDSKSTFLLSGACAGWGFWLFALPLDTLKAIVQTGGASSAREVVIESIERDGMTRTCTLLLRGWQLAFGRGAPSAAVTLTMYSMTYDLVGQYF